MLQELFEVTEDVLGLDLDVRAVVGHPRMDAVDRRLEVGRDLAGQEQPLTRADGRREIHAPHARVELLVELDLLFLMLGVGDERDQIRGRQRPRHHEPLDLHRAAGRRHGHVLLPDPVDGVEVVAIDVVVLRLDGVREARAGGLRALLHVAEHVVDLVFGVVAIVGELGVLAHRDAGLEVGRRQTGVEQEVPGPHRL